MMDAKTNKYDDLRQFHVQFFLDGRPLKETAEVCREHFHTYRTIYVWAWQELAVFSMEPGVHELKVEGRASGLAVDRVYLTTGDELPPLDAEWAAL